MPTTTTTTTTTMTTMTKPTTTTKTTPLGLMQTAASLICDYLDAHAGFVLATLFRLESAQAAALSSLPGFSILTAAARGDVELLERLRRHGRVRPTGADADIPRVYDALGAASERGCVPVLEWLKDFAAAADVPLWRHPDDKGAAVRATGWERSFGTSCERGGAGYGGGPIVGASRFGHVDVLRWWKDSGLVIRYSNLAVDGASVNGHTEVLDWWRGSGWEMRYTAMAIDEASAAGAVRSLQWWKDSGLLLRYSAAAMDLASERGKVDVLEWWKRSGLMLKYSEHGMDAASKNGHVDVLQWWKDSGLELRYSDCAMSLAGNAAVLQWWKDSGLQLRYSAKLLLQSLSFGDVCLDVLMWWKNSGLELSVVASFCWAWKSSFAKRKQVQD